MAILLIDSYDSFTFNLSTQLEKVTQRTVVTVHSDKISADALKSCIDLFEAIVIGPGPGSPENPDDIGVIPEVWQLQIPVFGVCLGFQSLVLFSGGKINKLNCPKHGQPSKINHNGDSIFSGVENRFESIRYHSLYGDEQCLGEALIALAWSEDDNVLMAGKHNKFPYYGVQYHPESICSVRGEEVLSNFWKLAQEYNAANSRTLQSDGLSQFVEQYSIKPSPLVRAKEPHKIDSTTWCKELPFPSNHDMSKLAISLCDLIKEKQGNDFVLLNSAKEPGRWSIIGVLIRGQTTAIHTKRDEIHFTQYGAAKPTTSRKLTSDSPVWEHLAEYMKPKISQHKNSPLQLPFMGGLIGYFSYEGDASVIDIDKTVLIDSHTSKIFVVSISPEDGQTYVDETAELIQAQLAQFQDPLQHVPENCKEIFTAPPQFDLPDQSQYMDKIRACQEYLKSGDSYELCLTAQTKITLEDNLDPWLLYKMLLKSNPAPYSCFLDCGFEATLVGSSPERFMSWNRDGLCEFRPIKGTVKKTPDMTREKAEKILNTTKERGENLMIVDLIRHDLNQLLDNVRVDKLMTVEEYHTVFQLVSVIQGNLPHENYLGFDLLDHSFPPGSMTGAPKKRSVELLKTLENGPRGVYSGVCGYWSVTDQGDWSVVIRSMFKNHDDDGNVWRIGAGGAITILSNPEDEWEEMCTKLERPLGVFGK